MTPIEHLRLFARARVVSSQVEKSGEAGDPGDHVVDAGGALRLLDRAGFVERLEFTALLGLRACYQ